LLQLVPIERAAEKTMIATASPPRRSRPWRCKKSRTRLARPISEFGLSKCGPWLRPIF
jgi:hypothetical protein